MTAGVLPHQDILEFCGLPADGKPKEESDGTKGPVRPCRRENVRSASYDLRLGGEYYLPEAAGPGHPLKTATLGASDAGIVIRPNQLVIVTALERVCLDAQTVGHLSLKVGLLLRGLIMANQSQVDAGYDGRIFALLYNLSNETVTLKYDDSIIRLELVRLAKPTSKPYGEGDPGYEGKTLAQSLEKPVDSSLREMQDTFATRLGAVQKETRDDIRAATLGALVIALFTLILTIGATVLLSYYGPIGDLRDDSGRLEERTTQLARQLDTASAGDVALQARIAGQQTQLASLRDEVERLRAALARLQRGG